MPYKYISCPTHSYLVVPFKEIVELKLQDKITALSYFDRVNGLVYLEEDVDVPMFTMTKAGVLPKGTVQDYEKVRELTSSFSLVVGNTSDEKRIRELPHYVHAERKNDHNPS